MTDKKVPGSMGNSTVFFIENDFGGLTTYDSFCSDNPVNAGSGGGVVSADPESNHQGVYARQTGDASNDSLYINMILCGSTSAITFTGSSWVVEGIISIDSVSDVHTGFGAFSDVDDVNDTDMAFFELDTGNSDSTFQCITRDGTGEAGQTKTDTGLTAVADRYYHYLIERTAGAVNFYLRDDNGGGDFTLECTHTTDLPTASSTYANNLYVETLAPANKRITVDYMRQSVPGLDR